MVAVVSRNDVIAYIPLGSTYYFVMGDGMRIVFGKTSTFGVAPDKKELIYHRLWVVFNKQQATKRRCYFKEREVGTSTTRLVSFDSTSFSCATDLIGNRWIQQEGKGQNTQYLYSKFPTKKYILFLFSCFSIQYRVRVWNSTVPNKPKFKDRRGQKKEKQHAISIHIQAREYGSLENNAKTTHCPSFATEQKTKAKTTPMLVTLLSYDIRLLLSGTVCQLLQ